jgi:hypothetical protein
MQNSKKDYTIIQFKRNKIIEEILETEIIYIRDIEAAVEIEKELKKKNLISQKQQLTIFSNR